MKKSILFLIVVLLLTLTALAQADFTPSMDKNTDAEVIVAGSYANFEALEAAFDGFRSYYPNVELNYVKLDDYNKNISLALYGEEAPNIYCLQPWMIGRENYTFLFESAENLADPALKINLDSIRSGLLYTDPEGNVPMLPIFTTAFGILVNEDLFEKEGLSVPTTYPELISVCEQLKAAGYPSPLMAYNNARYLYDILTNADFLIRIKDDQDAAVKLNSMSPEAAEYMRPTLEFVKDLIDRGLIDLEKCSAEIENDYQSVILRFFEGDVPMMIAKGDTVSGTAKRESLSENFTKKPFKYSFHSIPSTDDGLYFVNPVSLYFAVNKNCKDLEMTNEFMRFLSDTATLNEMARIKRLITPTTDFSLDGVYASLGMIDEAHTINPLTIGLLDEPMVQLRAAAYMVGTGAMTIDEALAAFGTFENL